MKDTLRQSMGWLHTWAGLLAGWVLFFTFLTGTAGYFDDEIDRWMQPERPLPEAALPVENLVAIGAQRLEATAPNAERWLIVPPDDRSPDLLLFWRYPAVEEASPTGGSELLDAATGRPVAHRDTGGGQLLYRMHYQLHYLPARAAEWIVGICTLFMLVAILTGIIIHKRIFRDFFTFRPRKGQRSWLDAHNLLSVLALPFHLMITWSGLMFFAYFIMSPVVAATYGFQDEAQETYQEELFDQSHIPGPAGTPAGLAMLGPILEQAEARTDGDRIQFLNIHNPGDAHARIVLAVGAPTPSRARTDLIFDGATGGYIETAGRRSAPMATWQALLGLHEGLFAGPVLRWLYFLSGLMGTAMIGAGLVLWTVKRRAKIGETLGFRLVERLNLGTVVGLPIAIAAYFWANRLIPVGISSRAAWEGHAMFIAWALMLLHAFIRPGRPAWVDQLRIAAAVFGLLPILNALTTDRHLGMTLPAGLWELAGVDLTMLAFGLAFALAARRVGQRRSVAAPAGSPDRVVSPARAEAAE